MTSGHVSLVFLLACGGSHPAAPSPDAAGAVLYPHQVTAGDCTLMWVTPGEHLGPPTAFVDLDGDGVRDLVATAPNSVDILSGSTGAVLKHHAVALGTISVSALVGDADGDGVPDIALGSAPAAAGSCNDAGICGSGGEMGTGTVAVVSSASGAVLWTRTGTATDRIGGVLGADIDEDGDGRADLVIGSSADGAPGNVTVVSAHDGHVLRMLSRPADASSYFVDRAFGADLAGAGHAELVVSDPGGPHGTMAGEVLIYADSTTPAATFTGSTDGPDFLGDDIAVAGDLDHDGVADLLIGAHEHESVAYGSETGRIYAVSGKTGATLWTVDGTRFDDALGEVAASIDVTGDGVPDVLVGASSSGAGTAVQGQSGRFAILDGATGATLVGVESIVASSVFSDGFGSSLLTLGLAPGGARVQLAIGAPGYVDAASGATVGMVSGWSCALAH